MKKNKEPGLFRKFISIKYEQAKRRKALRILNKQEWSIEFMEYLCEHAAKVLNKDIEIEIESPAGHKLRVKSVANHAVNLMADDDIFNRLDDEAAVAEFIREHSRR
jgi:hypothetical protein